MHLPAWLKHFSCLELWSAVSSKDGEVVVKVEVNGGDVFVWLHAKLEQLFSLVEDHVIL